MKRFSLLLCMVMALMLLMTAAGVAEKTQRYTSGDFEYTVLADGTAQITAYTGEAAVLEIPGALEGYRVTAIGDDAFCACDALTEVILPDSVTSIGNSAFYECVSLAEITLPDSVTAIGDAAFWDCDALTGITIPDSVTAIGYNPFARCDSLMDIHVSPGHPSLAMIDGALVSKADMQLICYPAAYQQQSYAIPQGIAGIGMGAFYDCDALTAVAIPDTVTSIGDYAFNLCDGLTTVTVPGSVTSIGDSAFCDCSALTTIFLPASVTAIGDSALFDCDPGLTIVAPRGSCAAAYARENDINYREASD